MKRKTKVIRVSNSNDKKNKFLNRSNERRYDLENMGWLFKIYQTYSMYKIIYFIFSELGNDISTLN